MRPVKLVLEGLRSYRGKTEIDFTDLSLFALIGDTGAGKSSIIEALCLALYGGTTWSGRNVVELMSDATDRMAVEFTFTADGDTWTVTRAHRRAGGAATHKLTSDGGEKVDGADAVNRRVQQVLGLTKDQFLRAVVMPQGSFEKLLKATPGERTDILKGIFRLQALDAVRTLVGTITGRWKVPIAELQGERRTLPPDPTGAVAIAASAHSDASKRAASLEAQVQAAEAADRATSDAKVAAGTLSQLSDRAVEELGGVSVTAVARIEEAASDLERRVAEATAIQQAATEAADGDDARASAVLNGFATRDAAVTAITQLRQAAGSLGDLAAARAAAMIALAALDESVPPEAISDYLVRAEDTATVALAAAQAAHRGAEDAHADALNAYRTWATHREQLALARERLADTARAESAAADSEQAAELAVDAASEAHVTAQAARARAAQTNSAAAAAAGCEPGDECPVCTQTLPEFFTAPQAEDLHEADVAVERAASDLGQCQRTHREAAKARANASALHAAAAAAVEQAEEGLSSATDKLRPHLSSDVDHDLTEHNAVAERTEAVANGLAAVRASAGQLADAREAAGKARTALAAVRSRWESEHTQHSGALEAANSSISAARAELARLPKAWRPAANAPADAIDAAATTVQAAVDDHAAHLQAASEHRAEAAAAGADLLALDTARATSVTQPLTALTTAATRAHTALDQLVGALPVAGAMPLPLEPDAALADVAAAVSTLHAAAGAVAEAAATEQVRLGAEAAAQTEVLQSTLSAAGAPTLGALRASAGAARSDEAHAGDELAHVTAAATRATQIDTILGVAGPFLASLDALTRLLSDGKFVGHLVREREVALLAEASRVLRSLSGDRFGFGDGFKVIDRHSGQERGPDTLSGGERFQASLALALALVEIATRSGGQLEAVFVDEGFGSLDAGSLDQALTTLGAVASDGKLVALVSHLRQVAEYVDQVLLVERDDATGSQVRRLDPTERDALLAEDARSRMTA